MNKPSRKHKANDGKHRNTPPLNNNKQAAQKRSAPVVVDLTEESPVKASKIEQSNSSTNNSSHSSNNNRTVTPPRKKFKGTPSNLQPNTQNQANSKTQISTPAATQHNVHINTFTSSTAAGPSHQTTAAAKTQKSKISHMESEIMRCYHQAKQTDQTYKNKLELVDTLFNMIVTVFPRCGLYLVGSSVNGLGFDNCDVDLCLMITKGEVSKDHALDVLYQIKRMLFSLGRVKNINVIKATVPILDFYDTVSRAECDMNINNITGVRNSHLLHCYCSYDRRVGPLVMFVKKWAKFQNINSAKDQTISSYALTLLVLHYLQYGVRGPPVLPSLQSLYPECFPEDVTQLKMDAKFKALLNQNTMSLGELLLGFFHYYTNDYRFEIQVGSVRLGDRVHIEEVRYHEQCYGVSAPGNNHGNNKVRSTWNKACIFVEEPFNLTNAARCVYNPSVFQRIMRVFRRSHHTLQQTKDVNSILKHPF